VSFSITEDWLQGRTTFGGLVATLAVQAMHDVVGRVAPLRALQTNFIGPVGAGTVQVAVTTLRAGKNMRQVQATLSQGGELAAMLVAVFGAARESALPAMWPQRPGVATSAEAAQVLPFIAGVTPNFTQHLQMAWAEGPMPFSGGEGWNTRIHLRLKDEALDPELLTVLLSDAPPTPALGQLKERKPASSVSWSLELRSPVRPAPADGWWRIDMDTKACAEGYANQAATLWTPDGQLASLGYQVVAVYG
jgi:acyl-CoA thioesterase